MSVREMDAEYRVTASERKRRAPVFQRTSTGVQSAEGRKRRLISDESCVIDDLSRWLDTAVAKTRLASRFALGTASPMEEIRFAENSGGEALRYRKKQVWRSRIMSKPLIGSVLM